MPTDELYAPMTYSWWVPTLGVALMLLAIAWVVIALVLTRRRPATTLPPPPPLLVARPGDPFAAARPVYLARVDALERRFVAGELDARALHLELSAVVRDFATVRQGLDARVLTLSELRRLTGTRRLAALIETYYRPSFAQDGHVGASPERAVTGARRVISQW